MYLQVSSPSWHHRFCRFYCCTCGGGKNQALTIHGTQPCQEESIANSDTLCKFIHARGLCPSYFLECTGLTIWSSTRFYISSIKKEYQNAKWFFPNPNLLVLPKAVTECSCLSTLWPGHTFYINQSTQRIHNHFWLVSSTGHKHVIRSYF